MDDKILGLFKQNEGRYLSGEDISERLRVTRAAVWKHMEKLRGIGYDIEAVPHLGYRLKDIRVFDMSPQTPHIETVILLEIE